MLRINLLPVKGSRKHDTARQELLFLGLGLAIIAGGLFIFHQYKTAAIDDLTKRITTVTQEIAQLKQDVIKVEDFKKKAETLESKIAVIENLQRLRIGPAKMLDDLGTILNDEPKVWLTKLTEKDGLLTLDGGAMEHENISDFQLALERRSRIFSEVKLTLVSRSGKGTSNYLTWTITCRANYRAG